MIFVNSIPPYFLKFFYTLIHTMHMDKHRIFFLKFSLILDILSFVLFVFFLESYYCKY